ncbi:hypothetical protein FRC00_008461 [Tulasnella sp. 408]|nr:hypothetical protein FRC00_008461 [Tulasnella sp. 408]
MGLTQCVATSCSADEAQTAQEAALATCKEAGVDLTNPLPGKNIIVPENGGHRSGLEHDKYCLPRPD